MNPLPATLDQEQTQAMLATVVRIVHGVAASLEEWTASPVSKRGKHRSVRYDLTARVAGEAPLHRYQWVGKFYERDDQARKVAAAMRELAATDCNALGGLVIPSVVAYHPPCRLLLLTYESGLSVVRALAENCELVLGALGRALAALHRASVTLEAISSPDSLLGGLRNRIAPLCARFPGQTDALRHTLTSLERQAPPLPVTPSFLHGDLGPSQLLWQFGRVVVLDFDKCTRGDPALDLGNLLAQLRRLTLRKPGKLAEFAALRRGLLDSYQRWSGRDPDLSRRVAWYEQLALLRKIRLLASDTTRHQGMEALRERQIEARRLLQELPALAKPEESPSVFTCEV